MRNAMNTFRVMFLSVILLGLVACQEEEFQQVSTESHSGQSEESSGSSFQNSGGSDDGGSGSHSNSGGGSGEEGEIGGNDSGGSSDGGNLGGFVTDSFTQENYTEEYDFLWVIDNSGSMSNIRTFMSQNLSDFVNVLESRQSLDWQMAVTITDHVAYNGDLVSGTGGVRVVNKNSADPTGEWSSIIDNIQSTSHSGWEQGLESGHAAIENHGNEFNRNGIPLIVTYVSDEEDYSCESNCNGFSGLPENQTGWNAFAPSRYNDQFVQLKNNLNVDVTVYSIIHLVPLGQDCTDDYGFVGDRYRQVQQASNSGDSLSICEDKLAESFDRVAQLTANLSACFTLTRTIITEDGMSVEVDDIEIEQSAQDGWVYDSTENNVCFNGSFIPQNGSVVEITYQSLEN